ncbi:MAG: TOBE domain-containing protein [Nitrososphaeria archaeon]
MKLSARNQFEGKVEDVEIGVITAKVKVKIEVPATVTSVITKEAVEDLKIKKGDKVKVIIKSTEVILAKE